MQRCSLSYVLFNGYIQKCLDEMCEKLKQREDIKIQRARIEMLRFADDIAIMTESDGDTT